MALRAHANGLPLVFAHLVGGQDEVVFEGASFALQADGSLAARALGFQEQAFELTAERPAAGPLRLLGQTAAERSVEADLWDALVLGVRDYLGKNGFPGAFWGCPAALTRPWCWPLRSMPSGRRRCGR